jgi:hypothetical protein
MRVSGSFRLGLYGRLTRVAKASRIQAIRHLESAVAKESAFEGVALRYGAFYGPGSGLFDGSVLDQLRRRYFP